MSSSELSGASLPEGIEVDEAAAYFGVVESSASLHTLLEMEPTEALCLFLEMTADLHLAEGDFDFETASQRMNCEGGEIYYLVAGHLGMMRLADPLFRYLGMEDSEGEPGGPDPGLNPEDSTTLLELTDSMTLLKFLSVAFQHGGSDAAKKYLGGLATRFSDPGAHLQEVKLMSSSLSAVLHSFQNGGEVAPIPGLAEASAMTISEALEYNSSASTVQQPSVQPTPVQQPSVQPTPVQSPAVSQPSVQPSVQSPVKDPVPLPGAANPPAPLKVLKPLTTQPFTSEVPVPLPPQSMPVAIDEKKDIEKEKDAFSGAFGLSTPAVGSVPLSTSPGLPIEETIAIPEPISGGFGAGPHVPSNIANENEPESFADVSMENMLQSITTSGHTFVAKEQEQVQEQSAPSPVESAPSPLEQTPIQGLVESQPKVSEMAPESPIQEVSQSPVSEAVQEPTTETASPPVVSDDGLPRPVRATPIRSPVSPDGIQQGQDVLAAQQAVAQQQALAAQQAAQHQALAAQQAAAQQAASQQQAVAAQQAAQQQAIAAQQVAQQAAQAYQPTIRSGVHCQGCGIGLDPTWNHCPVCGMGRA